MKKFFRSIIFAASLAVSFGAFATEPAPNAEAPKAEAVIEAKAEPAQAAPVAERTSTQVASEWVELGRGIGDALASGAERVGVVANDFAMSPLGILTAGLIVMHYAGDEVRWAASVLISVVFLFGFNTTMWYYSRKFFGIFSEDKGKFLRYDPVNWTGTDRQREWFFIFIAITAFGNFIGIVGMFGAYS